MSACIQVSQSEQVVHDGSMTKKINNLLSSSKTRLEGLQLLDLFLHQCPNEEFTNCCVSWMQSCCKKDDLSKHTNQPTHLLCKLLKASSNYPELKKSVSFFITNRYFDFFFKYLLHSEIGWMCTEICLSLYRGACGPFHEALEKHLTCEVEKNMKIPCTMASCLALLPSTGGGGPDGLNYKRNWKSQFLKFLSICHSVLNDLFTDVEDFQLQEYVAPENRHGTNGSERDVGHLAILFQNYCSALGFMLLNQYPAPKNVPSDLVFQLVCRGLAVNEQGLRRRSQTTDLLAIRKVLPRIHCALFSLLKAVIVTCKNQLLPYSQLICKLVKQSLQWTEDASPYEKEKPFVLVRESAYETLCDWLVVSRSGSCVDLISDVVISNAVNDIRSKEGIVLLKEAKSQNQTKNKEQPTRHLDAAADSPMCHAALKALEFLLKFAGVLLKAELHKFLQEFVVKLLIEVQRGAPPATFSLPACRVALYSVLLELVHQPCLSWPPPTNFALKLFSCGLNDSSPEVSSYCSAALNYVTIIIHPQYDNGGFPTNQPDAPNRIQGEEVRWTEEPMEGISEKGSEISRLSNDSLARSDESDRSKKVNDVNEGSEVSSDEDSRNTVTFSGDLAERVPETPRVDESKKEEISIGGAPAKVDDSDGPQSIVTEKLAPQQTPSPAREKHPQGGSSNLRQTPECREMKNPAASVHLQDSHGSKNISPEPANEGDHPKGRYFLRSQTKASSEEPEEALKRTCSVESLKSTPGKSGSKMTPSAQSSAKRPRTRALSKAEGSDEADAKPTHDDEEDIRAAFNDSFVDFC